MYKNCNNPIFPIEYRSLQILPPRGGGLYDKDKLR